MKTKALLSILLLSLPINLFAEVQSEKIAVVIETQSGIKEVYVEPQSPNISNREYVAKFYQTIGLHLELGTFRPERETNPDGPFNTRNDIPPIKASYGIGMSLDGMTDVETFLKIDPFDPSVSYGVRARVYIPQSLGFLQNYFVEASYEELFLKGDLKSQQDNITGFSVGKVFNKSNKDQSLATIGLYNYTELPGNEDNFESVDRKYIGLDFNFQFR